MRAEIVNDSKSGVKKAVNYIERGKIVVFPSDCVYGFATNAMLEESVEEIYKIKNRAKNKPLCVLTSKNNAKKYAKIPNTPRKLIDALWPGPVSIVVEKKNTIPEFVTAGKNTVALVCMDELALNLSNYSKVPITVTSANFSNRPPVTDEKLAIESFCNLVDAIIKGGKSKYGLGSTIIDFTNSTEPTLLREGPISVKEIEEIIGKLNLEQQWNIM